MKYPIGMQTFDQLIERGFVYVDKTDMVFHFDFNGINFTIPGALKRGQLEEFRKMLTSFLASIPYSMRRKENEPERERYFHYTFYLLLRLMSVYTVLSEKEQSEGRVDCIVETPKFVYIFKFKLDGTATKALKQIEDKGYARPYKADKRTKVKIGVNFSSKTGTIEEWEVR